MFTSPEKSKQRVESWRYPAILQIVLCVFGIYHAHAQQAAVPSSSPNDRGTWRQATVDVRKQTDTASSEDRSARDAYWNHALPPMTNPNIGIVTFPGASSPDAPEFPAIPNSAWVLGTFTSFHVFGTSGGGGIYTEMNIRVDEIFRTPPSLTLQNGDVVDVAIAGGQIIDKKGLRKVDMEPADYLRQLQPNHQYLLQLVYQPNGHFFLLGKFWDTTTGTVRPVKADDILRQRRGRSSIDGLSLNQLSSSLDSLLPKSH